VPEAVRISNERCYIAFEESFPLADAWCAIASGGHGINLVQRTMRRPMIGINGGMKACKGSQESIAQFLMG